MPPPATHETAQENLTRAICAPQFFVPSWPRLEDFARTIDRLDKKDWQTVEEAMQGRDQKYNGELALKRIDVITSPTKHFLQLNELIGHIFEKAAYISLRNAFPQSNMGYSENPLIFAARNAALEILHEDELREVRFPFFSIGLFVKQNPNELSSDLSSLD